MSKTVITVVALVAVAIFGYGIYSNVSNMDTTPEPTQQIQDENFTETQAQSLEDFLTMTNNQQCTFADAEAETSGTIYVANGNLRGDFVSSTDNSQGTDEVEAHVIARGQEVYLWMEGVAEGYKSSLESISDVSADLPINDIVNPDSDIDYECSPWTADESKFELPNIEFNDLTSLIESVGGNENNALQCAACDSLSGDAQAQCRAALSCN
jgi:predicted DNA binding CopG/RHH family protein